MVKRGAIPLPPSFMVKGGRSYVEGANGCKISESFSTFYLYPSTQMNTHADAACASSEACQIIFL